MGFSADDEAIIMDVAIIGNCFSLLGSLFILVSYCAFPELRAFAFKLVALLSLSDFWLAVAVLLGPNEDGDGLWYFQALVVSYFSVTSICWTVVIAWVLYEGVIRQRYDVQDQLPRLIVFAFGAPVITTLLPIFSSSYGHDIGFCWLKRDTAGTIFKMLQFYLPLWAAFGFNTYSYVKVYQMVQNVMQSLQGVSDVDRLNQIKLIKKLKYYPMILVVCWSFGTLNRLYNIVVPDDPSLWLTILHMLFGSLQGLLNAVVYGKSGPVKRLMIKTCLPCCPMSQQLMREEKEKSRQFEQEMH